MHGVDVTHTQFDDWRSRVALKMQPLHMEHGGGVDQFRAHVKLLEASGAQLWDIDTSAHGFERTARDAQHPGGDVISIAVQLAGCSRATVGGVERAVTPGSYTIFDWSMPQSRWFEETSRTAVFRVPKPLLSASAGSIRRVAGTVMSCEEDTGVLIGRVVSGLLDAWKEDRWAYGPDVASASFGLLMRLLEATLAGDDEPESGRTSELAIRIRTHIERHLGDPDLSPRRIADAHFISRRQLDYVFSQIDGRGVATWIRHARLHRIRTDLVDPLQRNRSIEEIADRWGLVGSTMSRAYSREFGESPSSTRRGVR
ncbi:MAG: helix-turn-helix domain-containing protein [Pseudoclavibacter sp.]